MSDSGTRTLRQQVEQRALGRCEYYQSQQRFSTRPFSLDHIIPRSHGGTTSLANLALACQGCNNHKYQKTEALDPASKRTTRLFHPRHDRWEDHFVWDSGFLQIIGVTAIGRATVEALQLNREELVNLRRVLYEAGLHPPAQAKDAPR